MNWLTKSVLPKIKAFVNKEETKQNLWIKCNSCDQMIFEKDLNKNFNICTTCNFHMPLYPKERMKFLLDDNTFEQIDYSTENQDILSFKAVILSGSPFSVRSYDAPHPDLNEIKD